MPLIPALGGRGRWISEIQDSLGYRASSRTARTAMVRPCLKKIKKFFKKVSMIHCCNQVPDRKLVRCEEEFLLKEQFGDTVCHEEGRSGRRGL